MKKIAIIDDEQDILDVLEECFSRDGRVAINTFNNPISALEKVRTDGFDLILLDIMMPQMDEITFLEKIKETNP